MSKTERTILMGLAIAILLTLIGIGIIINNINRQAMIDTYQAATARAIQRDQ